MRKNRATQRPRSHVAPGPVVCALAGALTLGLASPLCGQEASPAVPKGSPPIGAAPPAPTASPAPAAPSAPAAPQPATPAPAPAPEAAQTTAPAEPVKPKPKPKPKPAPPRETALSDDPTPVLQPETFFTTSKASERYAAIVDQGGWPKVGVALQPGAKGPAVSALRRRLAAEDDAVSGASPAWDAGLTEAVKRFQFRMGLRQTGVVAGATLRALDIPATVRFRQLASSAQRLAGVDFPFGQRYVVVNIPSTAVDAVENDRVVHRYTAIVGDVEHHSPEVSAKIVAVNINPTWTVPSSIIKNEIAPKMQRDPGYLARAKIRVLDNRGDEIDPRAVNWSSEKALNYTLRQDSGAGNSLGSIRISMPNPHSVYMHDTPTKNLFANDYRFLSHGCVRVQGVYDLAAWLLQDAPGHWDKEAIMSKIAAGQREEVKLNHVVPVIWVYMTGWASSDGTVHFRDDVYGVDEVGGEISR
ncbi:L,D-transpeptidase family protein [Methylocystis heyeri]|uniref:L,D-transpeptidase family protein n=1 Tax=Methylocystis heyeri TaxID=391905 RepID=A0A6B8KJR7_9HYPH|nr:L,D-transpeptidase family protein [Methylocystis heyeri]QGM46848.1 L,D-transpeptidase family protein [Methylocystis heyeri]